jgi:hypothetical protein
MVCTELVHMHHAARNAVIYNSPTLDRVKVSCSAVKARQPHIKCATLVDFVN